jgi:hypothetical protein
MDVSPLTAIVALQRAAKAATAEANMHIRRTVPSNQMHVAQSLLASPGEEKLFSRLNATFAGLDGAWVTQTTFSELIKAERKEVLALAGGLRDPFGWYLQTSVDLTFVLEHAQRPIFSIEFDGLGKGFSRDGIYLSGRPDPDPHRSQKLALKVRMAEDANYPLIVIGPDELQPVSTTSAR